jgi:hypothetical protein
LPRYPHYEGFDNGRPRLEEYNRHLLHKRYIIERLELFALPVRRQGASRATTYDTLGDFEEA